MGGGEPSSKQDVLISGSNIKTINGESILGEGNINVNTNIIDIIYPVGSIYISVSEINPEILFGFGKWEQIKDVFLLGAGNTYTGGEIGGESSHTLTIDEIPTHTHEFERSIDDGANWRTALLGRTGTSWSKDYYFSGGDTLKAHSEWNIRIAETGGGTAHNNMPPYLAVYMWKRIL